MQVCTTNLESSDERTQSEIFALSGGASLDIYETRWKIHWTNTTFAITTYFKFIEFALEYRKKHKNVR